MNTNVRSRDVLLEPFKLRHLTLKNRIISTAHASGLTENGLPLERYQRYHEEKAKGGIGMTMFGGSSVIGKDSSNVFAQIDITDDLIIPIFQQFSERIHRHGTALMCQLTHMGRRGSPYMSSWMSTVAPSRIRETLHRSIPREMDTDDITRVARDYGLAALRCKEGGLDGIETLTGGHLIGQFLSPHTNRRTDAYGGSIENRVRFALEVHEQIRKHVGPEFIVGIRYTIDEAMAGGLSAEDALKAAQILERSGLIDFFNVNFGRMDTAYALATQNMPTMSVRSAPFLAAAAQFKREVKLPVMHAAKIADLATARYAIEEGLLDLVGMTRAHIADPKIVIKLERGEEQDIRPCVGASYCRSHEAACIHNPSTGREDWLSHDVEPAAAPRKVTVVGGGIAGLEAARVAALRGHAVTLFEAAPELGGQVLLAQLGSWRKDLIGIVDWRVTELQRLGVQVHTNAYADAEMVLASQPDVVIIATGGMPYTEEIVGEALCTTTFDALTTHQEGKKSAVVYDGTGRHAAYICAERYADAGRDVTLVTLDRFIGAELGGRGDEQMWAKRFADMNLPMRHDLHLKEVKRAANGRLTAIFTHELTDKPVEIETDEVVVELGTTPIDDVFHELRANSVNDGRPNWERLLSGEEQDWPKGDASYELYRIGDAESSRDIHAAVLDAFRLARKL